MGNERDAVVGEEPRGEPFRILFVCTGNTCRSPMAEGIARRALRERGWNHVTVRSAGVAAFPGSPISTEALRVTARHGIDLGDHRSSPVSAELIGGADLILTMSTSHLHALERTEARDRTALLPAFARGDTEVRIGDGVPDPIGGDEELYEATFRELERMVESALDRLAPILVSEP